MRTCGNTCVDRTRRGIFGKKRPGGYDRIGFDFHPGQDYRSGAEAGAPAHDRSLEMPDLRAAQEIVIACEHARGYEYTIFQHRVCGEVCIRFDFAKLPNGAFVFDSDAAPNDSMAPDTYFLADCSQIRYQHMFSQNASRIYDYSCSEQASRSDSARWLLPFPGYCAVLRHHRLFADDGAVIDPDIVAYLHRFVDDDMSADFTPFADLRITGDGGVVPYTSV